MAMRERSKFTRAVGATTGVMTAMYLLIGARPPVALLACMPVWCMSLYTARSLVALCASCVTHEAELLKCLMDAVIVRASHYVSRSNSKWHALDGPAFSAHCIRPGQATGLITDVPEVTGHRLPGRGFVNHSPSVA